MGFGPENYELRYYMEMIQFVITVLSYNTA